MPGAGEVTEVLGEARGRLAEAGVGTVRLGRLVVPPRWLAALRSPRVVPEAEVWPLGVILLDAGPGPLRAWAAGEVVRARPAARRGYQAESQRRRGELAEAAFRGGFAEGEAAHLAAGPIDVAVRFDAYARGDLAAEALRGATVFSHPQGLAQCGAFIRRWSLQAVPCDSTAAALERAASAETPAIALAGVGKGEALGLRVLEREVDDLSGSITRFVILGDRDAWGAFAGGSRPTLRRLWVGDDPADAIALLGGGAGFDELLTDADGRWLLVSSRSDAPAVPPGAHALGAVPWSPRTPVVRAGA